MQPLNRISADAHYKRFRLRRVLCHWRCHVFTKRLSHAKQALAKSFSQVSVASATFRHWRKLASLSFDASAATSALGSREHFGSLAASEGASAGNLTGHYRVAEPLVQDVQDLPDLCPHHEGDAAHQGGRDIRTLTEHAQEAESAAQPALIATALQQVLTSRAGQSEAVPEAASSFVCASQSGKAAGPAAHAFTDDVLPASEEEVADAVEADPAVYNDQFAAETAHAAHHGDEPYISISKQSSDATSAANLQLLQTSKDPPEGFNPSPIPSIPAAVAAVLAGPSHAADVDSAGATAALSATLELPSDTARDPTILTGPPLNAAEDVTVAERIHTGSDLLQQQIRLESLHAPGRPAAFTTAEAMALQRRSSEEADHMLGQTLSQTDAVPSLTQHSSAEQAAVMKQTAAVKPLGDVASPEVAASDLCTNSAPNHAVAMAAEGAAHPSQPNHASLQLWSLPVATPTQLPPQLRSSQTGSSEAQRLEAQRLEAQKLRSSETAAPLHRAVSESALLSDFASDSLDTPVKPKRRSLLSRLRPSKGSKGGSDLGRTASDPALLMRQASADPETLKSPSKRLSLSALLRRGSSGNAAAAVIDPIAATAATAAGASTDVVASPGRLSSAVVTAGLESRQFSPQPLAVADASPLLMCDFSSRASSAQGQGLQPQSAPASPRGRGGTAPPKGNATQPDQTLDRAVSDPSMLARLSSGRHSISTTPRRMSLLGRLSRGRRSNSIMPEPSSGPMPGQLESAQEAIVEEVPFAEQPFAEQPLAEQPSAQQLSVAQPSVQQPFAEQPSAEQLSAEQPFTEQPFLEPCVEHLSAERVSAEQPFAEQPLAEQPSVEQPLAEQPLAEQPLAEQPLAATSLPDGSQSVQQLHEEQPLANLAELQGLAGESETPPQHTH